jgi:4-hydroxybenzoyl-CoA reductase subunit beta
MLMPPFTLHHPTSVEQACEIAQQLMEDDQQFDWVAGGTDLIPNYKWHINTKPHVISLAKIEGVNTISATEIGCMARLSDLTEANGAHPLIAEASSKVASSLIRKNATLGGNLCLDTRCFWYNQGEDWRRSIDWCHKADCGTGADCRVIPNQNTLCVATYQGDLAPSLMVLEGIIHIAGPSGERQVPIRDFYQLDGKKKNILEAGEFLLKVTLPKESKQRIGCYQKLRVRNSWDFPEAGIAASWIAGDEKSLLIASTALESIPKMHDEQVSEVLADGWNGADSIKSLSVAIQKSTKPVNNTTLTPRYRKKMVRVLTKRAIEGFLQ